MARSGGACIAGALSARRGLAKVPLSSADALMASMPDAPYMPAPGGRDLRLDFMRGFVMLFVICVHLEYLSVFSALMWERLGFFSSAEGFVGLSGVVLGMVYGQKLLTEGYRACAVRILRRALQLWRVNVFVIASVLVLRALPWPDTTVLTHWQPATGGQGYELFPPEGTAWWVLLRQCLLLQIGPHQFQVMGLYVLVIAGAPGVLWALHRGQWRGVLLLSLSVYLANSWLGLRLGPLKSEYAFPALSWQFLFYAGMVAGFHHRAVFAVLANPANVWLMRLALGGTTLFALAALGNPGAAFWPWPLPWRYDPASFQGFYDVWLAKERLAPLRLLNNLCLYAAFFGVLSRHWEACHRVLGWLLVPIGQASLYVFIWHVFIVLLVANTPLAALHSVPLNTLVHIGAVLVVWWMVRTRFLFAWVPR